MSVDVWVVAQKHLVQDDFDKVVLYNGLLEEGYDIPEKLEKDLRHILGDRFEEGEEIKIPRDKIIEVLLKGNGDVMYEDGLTISISELPVNTVAIRVYARA